MTNFERTKILFELRKTRENIILLDRATPETYKNFIYFETLKEIKNQLDRIAEEIKKIDKEELEELTEEEFYRIVDNIKKN